MTAQRSDGEVMSDSVGQVIEARLVCSDGVDVAAVLHRPDHTRTLASSGPSARRPPVLLLPGARGDHGAPHLLAIAGVLAAAGHPVVRAALSPRPPGTAVVGPAERSVGRLVQVLAAARRLVAQHDEHGGDRAGADTSWVIGGASYGGRVASLAVAQEGGAALGVVGLLLVAYPLHPPGRPEQPRVAHLGRIDVPTLLLSGDRDPFLTPSLLEQHLPSFRGPTTLVLVDGAVHDLSVSSRSAPDGRRRTPGEVVVEHSRAICDWAAGLPGREVAQG